MNINRDVVDIGIKSIRFDILQNIFDILCPKKSNNVGILFMYLCLLRDEYKIINQTCVRGTSF